MIKETIKREVNQKEKGERKGRKAEQVELET